MKCITLELQTLLQKTVPQVDLTPLSGKEKGKLRLSPEQLLVVIQAWALAEWALGLARRLHPRVLPRGPGGKPSSTATPASCSWRWSRPCGANPTNRS